MPLIQKSFEIDPAMEHRRDRYASYSELRENEKEGLDYRVGLRYGRSGIAVMAPHGGNIEPGTSEIASVVAGEEHGFYELSGLRTSGNRDLHLKSTLFDEPRCLFIARQSQKILTVHGCKGREEMVYLGGLCFLLKEEIERSLTMAGFTVGEYPGLQGKHPLNLCNLGSTGSGVQLELTSGLRRTMFENLTTDGRRNLTPIFDIFTTALRNALLKRGSP